VCDDVAVMYLGEIVEKAPTQELFDTPYHPYSEGLLGSVPEPAVNASRDDTRLSGEIPSPTNPPSGCSFHPRCPYATTECERDDPPLEDVTIERDVACHHWETLRDSAPDDQ